MVCGMIRLMGIREHVTDARILLGWKRYRLAKEAGLTATQVKEIEEGTNRNPEMATVNKLAKALGVSPGALLDGADISESSPPWSAGADHDEPRPVHAVMVPVQAIVVGGMPEEAEEGGDVTEYPLLHHLYKKGRYVIRIRGESMWPNYWHGDLVLVEPVTRIEDGKVAVVRIGGESTVKRFFRSRRKGGGCSLKADNTNPSYRPIEAEDGDYEIVARVLKIVEGVRP